MTRQAHLVGSFGLRGAERPGYPRNTHIDLEKKVEVLSRELGEALEQQTATSELLRVISNSPGELGPVSEAMLESATRLCGAKVGILFYYRDGAYTAFAKLGVGICGIHGARPDPSWPGHWPWPHHQNQADGPHCRYARRASVCGR